MSLQNLSVRGLRHARACVGQRMGAVQGRVLAVSYIARGAVAHLSQGMERDRVFCHAARCSGGTAAYFWHYGYDARDTQRHIARYSMDNRPGAGILSYVPV
ncbi:hypothetical protein SDC9_161119 [bioreactor metagenome]|uniref:Uncharacterized protein n=1 Tax=bioreactor metagenome TaxID=1076179 RepID=A0A645FNM3_9ZZZZ